MTFGYWINCYETYSLFVLFDVNVKTLSVMVDGRKRISVLISVAKDRKEGIKQYFIGYK